MNDPDRHAESRALRAAFRALDEVERAVADGRPAASVPRPEVVTLRALTVRRLGEQGAWDLVGLGWVAKDVAPSHPGLDDSQKWLINRNVTGWPTVMRREATLGGPDGWWPWLSPTRLREAASSFELMIDRGVLDQCGLDVGGPVYELSTWVWTSLREVHYYLSNAAADHAGLDSVESWR